MHSSSRIIFAEDLVGASPWKPRALEGDRRTGSGRRSIVDRRESEALAPRSPTYEDGLQDGIEQGLARARIEQAEIHRLEREAVAQHAGALLGTFTAQLAGIQQSLADEVTGLAVEIARSAVSAALRIRADLIAPAVAEALASIADEHAKPVVRMNPEDISLLGEVLAPVLAMHSAQLVADPGVGPGGCIIDTPRANVDGTLATRWRRSLAAIGRDDEWVET
jgi:flagellar assembly protein FliH